MFCDCWDDKQRRKDGALISNSSQRSLSAQSRLRDKLPLGIRRSFIPWVWSRQFHHTYLLGEILGQGAYATVHEAILTASPWEGTFAVKVITRNRISNNPTDIRHLHSELQILLDISHDHIVQLHELYKTPQFYFIVMEHLQGGELFDRICEKECYSEMQARNVCRTVLDATAYCHAHQIAHRDLKPENLLLVSRNDDTDVKIADFGFAVHVPRPQSLVTLCGSAPFTAPEIVNYQKYDERVDNWSLGVIVFNILGGYNPFHMDTVHLTHQQIRQANYQFDSEYWDGISPDAKNLIRRFLTINVDKRMTSSEALLHPWMTGRDLDKEELMKQNFINIKKMKMTAAIEREARSKTVRSVSMYWLVTRP